MIFKLISVLLLPSLVAGELECHKVANWDYNPSQAGEMEVHGVFITTTGGNENAFQLFVNPGKLMCVSVQPGQLKSGDNYLECQRIIKGESMMMVAEGDGVTICGHVILQLGASGSGVNSATCPNAGPVHTLPLDASTATQPDTQYEGYANMAIDSNKSGDWHKDGGCTSSTSGIPWWSVELREKAVVTAVEILNRHDCCAERLTDFNIYIDKELCYHHKGTFGGRKSFLCDKPLCGKTVKISLDRPGHLTLCDVVVKGWAKTAAPPEGSQCSVVGVLMEIPLRVESATQSGTAYGGEARFAVDGNKGGDWYVDGVCSGTTDAENSFWEIEFKHRAQVRGVYILNRSDCCADRLKNFYIKVDDRECAFHSGYFTGGKLIICESPRCGQKLRVELTGSGILTMCDLVVYGHIATD